MSNAAPAWGIGPSQSRTMRDRNRPPLPEWTGDRRAPGSHVWEKRVPQYGPEWREHVAKGGDLRNGNILILPIPRRRKR